MPCDHQQRTECGWHQGYPFVSDCYALVGASCSRSCPSTSILGYIEESPRRCSSTGTSWVCQFFFWREIFVLTVLVIYISTHKPGFESVSGLSVLLVIQVISYKTDVTKYMCIFPVCISTQLGTPWCRIDGPSQEVSNTDSQYPLLASHTAS